MLVERRLVSTFLKTVELMFPIPFLGICQQKSQVCHAGWVLQEGGLYI